MFIENKYHRIYFLIIENAKKGNRVKSKSGPYYERHHILPKSVRPDLANLSKNPENSVLLTAKEHILCHRLLCKFTEGKANISALRAYHSMCFQNNGGNNKRFPSAKQLELARKAASIANSGIRGIKGPPEWSNCSTLEEWKSILEEYVASGTSDPNIGKIYGVSAQAVHSWRSKLNVNKRRSQLRDADWLQHQYVVLQKSCDEIAKEVGCTGTAIQHKLNYYNIQIRNASERQQLANPKRAKALLTF